LNLLRRSLDYLALYGAHGLKAFTFIILIPHFTSVFPKFLWGQILTVQALALWFQIIVEYGFNLSATRSMAKVRDNVDALASLISGVVGAKVCLSLIVVCIAILSKTVLKSVVGLDGLVIWGTVFAISQGFNPVWYFLARQQFGKYAAVDFFNRLLYLLVCYFLITSPSQGSYIFIFGVITGSLANFAGYYMISKEIPLRFPKLLDCYQALREGFSVFVFVSVTSLYTTLNLVILGFSQTNVVVATYGISDRIVRALGGLLDPLNRIIYSKLSYLYHHDFIAGLSFLRKAAILLLSVGIVIFIIGEIAAPLIIHFLAPSYIDSVKYLRILLIFIPALAINNIVGLHIMLPLGMDKIFNRVFVSVSLVSVLAMFFLVPIAGSVGMGIITVFTEILAGLGMIYFVWRSKILSNSEKRGAVNA